MSHEYDVKNLKKSQVNLLNRQKLADIIAREVIIKSIRDPEMELMEMAQEIIMKQYKDLLKGDEQN